MSAGMWSNLLAAAARLLGIPRGDIERPDRYGKWRVPMIGDATITPELIGSALKEARSGHPHRQAALFAEAIGKSGRLAGNLGIRCKAVASREWTLTAASSDAADKRVVEWLEPQLRRVDLASALRRLTEAVAYGYAAEQIHWHQQSSDALVTRLTHWPTRFLRPDEYGDMTIRTSIGSPTGVPMEPAQFIVHQPGELSPDPVTSGLMRSAIWLWFFKNYCLKAWVMYVEKYGQPFRVGKYGPGASKEDKDTAFQALVRMGSEAVAMLPDSMQLELLQVVGQGASGGSGVFDALANRCDAEITILILGQTLTTSVGKEGGALATASVHQGIRQDLLEWDGRMLSRTITEQLVAPWVRFQFGEGVEIPNWELQTSEAADLKTEVQILKGLVVECGLPVSQAFVYERYGIDVPEDGEELLVPPSSGRKSAGDPTGLGQDVDPDAAARRPRGQQLSRADVVRIAAAVRAHAQDPRKEAA